MNKPLISIIVPTYNYAHLITETLGSIRRQTYQNWECLIIDDGSFDATEVVVHTFLRQCGDSRFQYIKQTNSGTSAAKNKGVELAQGDLIQFLDADDLLSPTKLESGLKVLQQKAADLVFSGSRFFRETGGRKQDEQKYPDGFLATETLSDCMLLQRLITNNIVTISAPLIRIELFRQAGGFEGGLLNNEDWLLWFTIALKTTHFEFDGNPASYVHIRLHGHSAMNQHHAMFLGEEVVRNKMAQLLTNYNKRDCQHALLELNQDLLALHRVRSLRIGKGMSHIVGKFIKHPVSGSGLLKRGIFKLMARLYNGMLRK